MNWRIMAAPEQVRESAPADRFGSLGVFSAGGLMNRVLIVLTALAAAGAGAQPADYMQRLQRDLRELFAFHDSNRDGTLTREEVSSSNRLAPLFTSIDVNRDEQVTRDEFDRWLADIPMSAR
jgi:hypothetical protein